MNLKPCPYCGNTEPYMTTILWSCKQITCDQCSMKGPSGYERDVADKWNALSRPPIYTSQLPCEKGWYWLREPGKCEYPIRVDILEGCGQFGFIDEYMRPRLLHETIGEFAEIPTAKETANVV